MLETFDINKYNDALSRGLCKGLGSPNEQMCIEAAVCYAFGLPHDDDPQCVSFAVRSFKVHLNDCDWSSPESRAEGLRDLGLAQLGSLGVVDDNVFAKKLALSTVNKLIPALFREVFPDNEKILELALKCEQATDLEAARNASAASASAARNAALAAASAASAAANSATTAATYANSAAYSADAVYAADAVNTAVNTAVFAAVAVFNAAAKNDPDKYLKLSANIALDILKEMNSPGCQFLTR